MIYQLQNSNISRWFCFNSHIFHLICMHFYIAIFSSFWWQSTKITWISPLFAVLCLVVSNSLWPHGLESSRLHCPWDFSGKNTGVGCHFLLQGIFTIQGLKLHLLHLLQWASGFFYHCSVQFSCSAVSDSLQPHEPQHIRPPGQSTTPRVHQDPCPLCWWCHPAISSVVPFSSCPQFFPASGSSQMSKLSASGGQSIGVSASTSVPPMSTQD